MTFPVSTATRQSIVMLFLESLSERKIVEKLCSIGISVSKSAVHRVIKDYKDEKKGIVLKPKPAKSEDETVHQQSGRACSPKFT